MKIESVSVSLRSIIHSYQDLIEASILIQENSFRLLTEYHSFLSDIVAISTSFNS